jgi:rod shape-determining protein MreB
MDLGTEISCCTPNHTVLSSVRLPLSQWIRKNIVIAVSANAKQFLGRTPKHIKTIRPMKDVVIAKFDTTA